MSPLAAGALGTVLGAVGAASVAVFLLSDEKTRKRVGNVINGVREEFVARVKDMDTAAKDLKKQVTAKK